jgi:apolipoprotein N-acyltransferase
MLAGISYVLCFPRFDLPVFSLLVMLFLLFTVHSLERRAQAIKLGFILSAIIACGGFHWIVYVAQNFGNMPLPLALGLLGLFCLVAAPQMIAFLVVGLSLRSGVERLPLWIRPLFWASLFTGFEYLARFLKIFPEHLGNTLIHFLSLAQAASLGGVSILTFLPLWVGASVYYLRKNGSIALPSLAASILILSGLWIWGHQERIRVNRLPVEIFRAGLIQHNMDDAEKQFARMPGREVVSILLSKLLEKTKEMASIEGPKPDLILWAETAYPMSFSLSNAAGKNSSFAYGYANLVSRTVELGGVPLLFGSYEEFQGKTHNSGILLGSDGTLLESYRKQVLLIFGEYFPGDTIFPDLKNINPLMGDFGRGPGPVPIRLPWKDKPLLLGVNICYEEILPEYMRGYALAGSRMFINLTKDSWFGNTFEPWQHFQLSVLRSIEHRVPLLRATNTGLSGFVTASGEVTLISDPYHEAYKVVEVPLLLEPEKTLYTRFGEWFAWLMLLVSAVTGWRARRSLA